MYLLSHLVWATVALAAIGACLYAFLKAQAANWVEEEVKSHRYRLLGLDKTIKDLAAEALEQSKDLKRIDEGLQKLKAIPPKQPRL